MIPISDNVIGRTKPIITYILISVSVVVFFWELYLDFHGELGKLINTWGIVPVNITQSINIAIAGNQAAWVYVVISSTSVFLGMFLHASFAQILANLIFLWVFGKSLEKALGNWAFLGFFLICSTFTGIIQVFSEPSLTIPLVGMNSAIASILGGYVIRFPHAKIDSILPLILVYIPVKLQGGFYLFWWFVQQMFYGIGTLNIPPNGANKFSTAYWMQGAGIFIGASFMWLWKRRQK
jgi:membrane associated rhomboid family serine protease